MHERAASMFDVTRTVDNDGTGVMSLYNFASPTLVDVNGDPLIVETKTDHPKAFKDGVTGGKVVTTAAELVTAGDDCGTGT